MFKLVLYSTSACHLCELAEALLSSPSLGNDVSWETVDIADNDKLLDQYGLTIPVVCRLDSGKELGWPFDEQMLADFLS